MKIMNKAKEEVKETKKQFFDKTVTLLNGAFALVAALAWNEAIKALIDEYFPASSGVYSKFIYALIITLLVVVITSRLSKLQEEEQAAENPEE